jgi:hypothetical protein
MTWKHGYGKPHKETQTEQKGPGERGGKNETKMTKRVEEGKRVHQRVSNH